ncbi:MAG: DUF1566 domain-containing protein [Candidatus Aminicenantes bacterium]|nr:DUF1566 domain-containing protein [Candidatus Aminicenantes bacterium]
MEDEHQRTLKGKVKILYQLEKWQDVIKLCEQYNEKYGKDVEIDMMRFKCERHLQKISPAVEQQAKAVPAPAPRQESPGQGAAMEFNAVEEPPLLLTEDHRAGQKQGVIIMNENPVPAPPKPVAELGADEPFSPPNELIITDPFAEPEPKPDLDHTPYEPYFDADELVISEPAAEDQPIFSLASDEPPVIAGESSSAIKIQIPAPLPEEEMAIIEEPLNKAAEVKIAFDFASNPAMAFDVEPVLAPALFPEAPGAAVPEKAMGMSAEPEAHDAVIIEKPAEVWHPPETFQVEEKVVENARPADEPDMDHFKTPEVRKRTAFNLKYILLLILPLAAAVILWLALSGKLNLTGSSDDEAIITPVATAPPAARQPAAKVTPAPGAEVKPPVGQEPAAKAGPTTAVPQVDESEKLVNEKIKQANDLLKKNDVIRALAVVLEAKRIKVTEPLLQLEELITSKIREDESKAAEQKQAEQNMVQSEDQAYDKANAENTVAAWQGFLQQYPQGERAPRVRNKIIALEKQAAQMVEQEFQQKILQAQKLKLRSDYLGLNQADVNAIMRQLGKPAVRFETVEHGGAKVIVDFSCGLMWTLWNKPMVFDKAKWWANRIYAGYSGWRLPTIEESLTLLQMDRMLYASLADFIVWTGDSVSDQLRAVWVLRLPQGQLLAQGYDQIGYVWAVRKAGK